jgi:hypothetical protein
MSISGILSSLTAPYQPGLNLLKQDIQAGNQKALQADFSNFQKAFATSGAASQNTSSPINQVLNQVVPDLKTGTAPAAPDSTSVNKLPQPSVGHHFNHHHRVSTGGGNLINPNPTPVPLGGTHPTEPPTSLPPVSTTGDSLDPESPIVGLPVSLLA